ncbi:hypothetical protein HK405_013301, partial [Cladochytrium tenue]
DPVTGARNVFTWNRTRFPDPPALFAQLHEAGIRVAANIKPWLLAAHPDYERVKAARGFVWDNDTDSPCVCRLWSAGGGTSATGSYVDFSSAAGRKYWKDGVKSLLAVGIEGIWNDNNEFSLPDDTHTYAHANLGGAPSSVGSAGRALQTLLMASASHEALLEHAPARRPFLITRAAAAGVQRFAAQSWSGDNWTSWDTLKFNVAMGLNAGLCGLVGYGHDVGGFAGPQPGRELLVRWVQNGVFHPRFCIHSWKPEGVTEPWMYPDVLPVIRDAIHLRYKLIPYLYTLHHEAAETGHPVIRPLVYEFQHDQAVQDRPFEFMLGPWLLVASVLEEGATTRSLRLPLLAPAAERDDHPPALKKPAVTASAAAWCDVWSGQWHPAGTDVSLPAPLHQCGVLLARAGALVPTGPVAPHVATPGFANTDRLVWCFPPPLPAAAGAGESEFVLVDDDGEAAAPRPTRVRLWMRWGGDDTAVSVGAAVVSGTAQPAFAGIQFVLPLGDTRTLRADDCGGAVAAERGVLPDGRAFLRIPLR